MTTFQVEKRKKTCQMQLCGVVEALQGTCTANKNKGCCVDPMVRTALAARTALLDAFWLSPLP